MTASSVFSDGAAVVVSEGVVTAGVVSAGVVSAVVVSTGVVSAGVVSAGVVTTGVVAAGGVVVVSSGLSAEVSHPASTGRTRQIASIASNALFMVKCPFMIMFFVIPFLGAIEIQTYVTVKPYFYSLQITVTTARPGQTDMGLPGHAAVSFIS